LLRGAIQPVPGKTETNRIAGFIAVC
jgi:hypothetical protein